MLHQLYANVYRWTERHGKGEKTYDWNSYAIHIDGANVLALVDPLPLTSEEIRQLEKIGPPTHILLTCNWHLRESEIYRRRWGCEIYLNKLDLDDAETSIDGTFQGGERLWDAVKIIELPGVNWKEETALLVKRGDGILIIGDAVVGGRADLGVLDGELGVHPPARIADLRNETARKTLDELMEYPFDAMCFGHGTPILSNAKAALQRFIDACT
jgi:glyoxylase-like metal-dependent hydrolase (beta-lactamase superfamily II)